MKPFFSRSRSHHFSKTLHLAWPVVLSQMSHVLVGLADNLMVGRIGAAYLAASAFATSLFVIPLVTCIGLTQAISPLVAQAVGEGAKDKQEALLPSGFTVGIVVGVLMAFTIFPVLEVLPFLDQTPEVNELSSSYLVYLFLSIIPIAIYQAQKNYLEGLSLTKPAMVVGLLALGLNVVLNFVFIYGLFGFPEMRLDGAGLATLISRVFMVVALMPYILKVQTFPSLSLKNYWVNPFKDEAFGRILNLGWPISGQILMEAGAFVVASVMVGWLGTVPLATHQIALNIASITFMGASGISAATTIRVGNYFGAKNKNRLEEAGYTGIFLVASYMAITGILLLTFHQYIPYLFTNDMDVITGTASLLFIAAAFQLSDGLQNVGMGALRGLNDVRMPLVIAVVSYWLICLPIAYFLGFKLEMGTTGIWWGLLIGLTIAALLLIVRFNRLTKKLSFPIEENKEELLETASTI